MEWEDTLSQQQGWGKIKQGWVKITPVINRIALEKLAIREFDPVPCKSRFP